MNKLTKEIKFDCSRSQNQPEKQKRTDGKVNGGI